MSSMRRASSGTFWLGGLSDRPAAWQRQNATAWIARRIRISFTFDLDGLVLGGGSASPAGDQVRLFRAMVDAEGSGCELAGLVRTAQSATASSSPGRPWLRMPREYSPDHPRADLLRRRSVYAEKPIDTDDVELIGKALRPTRRADHLVHRLRRHDRLGEAVGPLTHPASRRGVWVWIAVARSTGSTGCG